MKLAFAFLLLLAVPANAALVQGLDLIELTSPQFANSTVLSIAHFSDGTRVMSDGANLIAEDGSLTPLYQVDGGPLAAGSGGTWSLAIDSSDRLHVNEGATGRIFRRDGTDWTLVATIAPFVDDMKFDAAGDLIVATRVNDQSTNLWRVSAGDGSVTPIASGLARFKAFDFDADGNIVFSEYIAGAIHRVHPITGADELLHGPLAGGTVEGTPVLAEAILVTAGGNYVIGLDRGVDRLSDIDGNRNRLDRFNPSTGDVITLGLDWTGFNGDGFRTPIDFDFDNLGQMQLVASGSIQPQALIGDLDLDTPGLTAIAGIAPEPATMSLLALAAVGLVRRRRHV